MTFPHEQVEETYCKELNSIKGDAHNSVVSQPKNKKKKNQILRNHLFIQYAKFSKKLRFFSTIRTSAITNVRRKLFYLEKK